jgi:hypothetical protein
MIFNERNPTEKCGRELSLIMEEGGRGEGE